MRDINIFKILGEDKDTNAVFVKANNGSVVLDVIPASVYYLNTHKVYDLLHMQDFMGHIVSFNKGISLEDAIAKWERAVRYGENDYEVNFETAAPLY